MAITRKIEVTHASPVQIIPPEGLHTGPFSWTLIGDATNTVYLVDQANGAPASASSVALAAKQVLTLPETEADILWAVTAEGVTAHVEVLAMNAVA